MQIVEMIKLYAPSNKKQGYAVFGETKCKEKINGLFK